MADENDPISGFFAYYGELWRATKEIPEGPFASKIRKLCLVSLIDGIAKALYPNLGNRERFVRAIKHFGSWDLGLRISMPHLKALLDLSPEPDFEPLRQKVQQCLGSWLPGELVELDRDLPIEVTRSLWPKDKTLRSTLGRIDLEDITHVRLFYAYRNLLVHEFRDRPDYLNMDDRQYPFYMNIAPEQRWDIFYPTGFFYFLGERILGEVERYFKRSRLNPRRYLYGMEYLIEELCEKGDSAI